MKNSNRNQVFEEIFKDLDDNQKLIVEALPNSHDLLYQELRSLNRQFKVIMSERQLEAYSSFLDTSFEYRTIQFLKMLTSPPVEQPEMDLQVVDDIS